MSRRFLRIPDQVRRHHGESVPVKIREKPVVGFGQLRLRHATLAPIHGLLECRYQPDPAASPRGLPALQLLEKLAHAGD